MARQEQHLTLYCVLGVDKSATAEEIDTAFFRKAAELHPDRGGKQEEMATLNRAAMVLRDPARRAKYDKELELFAELCPSCDGAGRKWKQKGLTNRVPIICTTCNGAGVLRWKIRNPAAAIQLSGAVNTTKKRKSK